MKVHALKIYMYTCIRFIYCYTVESIHTEIQSIYDMEVENAGLSIESDYESCSPIEAIPTENVPPKSTIVQATDTTIMPKSVRSVKDKTEEWRVDFSKSSRTYCYCSTCSKFPETVVPHIDRKSMLPCTILFLPEASFPV